MICHVASNVYEVVYEDILSTYELVYEDILSTYSYSFHLNLYTPGPDDYFFFLTEYAWLPS